MNAVAVNGGSNTEVRTRGHAVNEKLHAEIVTCGKPSADHADIWARPSIDLRAK